MARSISQEDWNLFKKAYWAWDFSEGLRKDVAAGLVVGERAAAQLNAARDHLGRAIEAWEQIVSTSGSERSRRIAQKCIDNPLVREASKPLSRWSGGSLNAPGSSPQTYLDWPEIWVSPTET